MQSNPIAFTPMFKKNYGSVYRADKDTEIGCYTKKQMKSFYPRGDYSVEGELSPRNHKSAIGALKVNNKSFPVRPFKSHSKLFYAVKGYIKLEGIEDGFLALMKNALPARMMSIVLVLFLTAGSLYLGSNWSAIFPAGSVEFMTAAKVPDLEEGAVMWQGELPRSQNEGETEQGKGIEIPGYKSITIDANQKDVFVNFVNPEGNPCYFVISLVLEDGTELYKSKMVEPGMGLYKITLNHELEPGEYPAIVKYETFGLDGLEPMNGAEIKFILIAV
ncbi:MAG TPA: hypothetical protein PKB13_10990 [Clostridia bacterium]|nr:hypothetical protein [Clostridia bacterium]